jgi:hypothetical protein
MQREEKAEGRIRKTGTEVSENASYGICTHRTAFQWF